MSARRAAAVRRPPPRRRGEHGVSILLAMLVLFVLAVVITELRYKAAVELDSARAFVEQRRMWYLADAARLQAEAVLLMDIEQAQDTSSAGGGGDPAAGAGGDLFGGADGGGSGGGDPSAGEGEDEQAASVADTTARTDSFLDEWNNPTSLAPALGQDYELYVEVVPEDGKLNLLGLWTADEQLADEQRAILRALLDRAFEGTSQDISYADATQLLDRLEDWGAGKRGSFDPVPKPLRKLSNEEEEQAESGVDTDVVDLDEVHLPLTLGELALIEGFSAEHLAGFVENDVFHPGLHEYLTLHSHLELKPAPPVQDNPFGGSPFTQGSLFDKPSPTGVPPGEETDPDGSGADEEEPPPSPTNDGFVNVNTAPLAVLRALAPDEIPTSFLEKIVEFRNRIHELKEGGALGMADSLFAQFDDGLAAAAEEESKFKDEEDEDITDFVFELPDEAIDKVEEEYGIELSVDPEYRTTFVGRLTVTSQVFTIKILVRDPRSGRRASYRSIVWRMVRDSGPVVVTLMPLEPFHDPRRLDKDFPQKLEDVSQGRFEAWDARTAASASAIPGGR